MLRKFLFYFFCQFPFFFFLFFYHFLSLSISFFRFIVFISFSHLFIFLFPISFNIKRRNQLSLCGFTTYDGRLYISLQQTNRAQERGKEGTNTPRTALRNRHYKVVCLSIAFLLIFFAFSLFTLPLPKTPQNTQKKHRGRWQKSFSRQGTGFRVVENYEVKRDS